MPKLGSRSRSILLAGGLTAILAAPIASGAGEGRPVDGGARNPAADPRQEYTRETEIIANTNTYGTRQSNKSNNGGGAVYGCRSAAGGTPANNEPCLRATNLVNGLAFEFNTNRGVLGGTITVGTGGDGAKPFTTNATGVATGLNADQVDGRSGDQLLGRTEKAADADRLDGSDSADFARAGDILFARVAANGTVRASRGGAVTATFVPADNRYVLTFARDVSACSFTVTEDDTEASGGTFAATSTGAREVTVDYEDGLPPQPFNLHVIC